MISSTRCPLLLRLTGLAPTARDPEESRRGDPRQRCQNVFVAMKSPKRPNRNVKVYDVSKSGISLVLHDRLEPGDIVSLNTVRPVGPFHRFRVVHVHETGPNYRIGMCLEN